MAGPAPFSTPNLYQVHGGGIHATYSTTGIDGKPQFTYHDAQVSKSFSGGEIQVVKTSIGDLVTVTIRLTIDAGSTSFSLLAPTVNLTGPGHPSPITTEGITTMHRLALVPALNKGQTELYHVTTMHGTAEQVVF